MPKAKHKIQFVLAKGGKQKAKHWMLLSVLPRPYEQVVFDTVKKTEGGKGNIVSGIVGSVSHFTATHDVVIVVEITGGLEYADDLFKGEITPLGQHIG